MKFSRQIALLASLILTSSCAAMFNDNKAEVSINSNPPGADIFIEGRSHGRTPATLQIEAKNQTAVLNKEGYGSAQVQLETWYTAKNGKCLADAMFSMFIIPAYSFYSGKCSEFKEKEYFVNIPNNGSTRANNGFNPVAATGNNPQNMIDYYYNQNAPQNSGMNQRAPK
ncbi:MAG: PEGA domain-containing protein [Proteobacteria bacterium]|nr:PEGA domain-containing protein [Pseudomonadota bacterium]